MQHNNHQHWFKEAIVYSFDIRGFKDGNMDGLGDIKGLLAKFDHLVALGVNCIWMTPFYCSNHRDDGYDVTDYYQIDPKLGDFDDFDSLVKKAKSHGVKVILDLVINHTSTEHPWFKKAVEQPDSMYYDYYIWKKKKPKNDKEDVVFKTIEDSNWAYQPDVSAYFYHTFYKHQPDLNIVNPRVQEEILKIIDFWMKKDIDGFRLDAVPHVLRNKGDSRFKGDPFDLLNTWTKAARKHNKQAVLIGEVDVEPEDYPKFYEAKKLTGIFNFYLNNYCFLALADEKAAPLISALGRLPEPDKRHYLNFLRNHDELDLERLTEEERQRVYDKFAPEPSMIIYDRGIRRRLPPMVQNNQAQIRLAFSVLTTLPGVPVIRYGEEIGMGDDLNLPERKSVRTAMQWSSGRNGGFSDVVPQALGYPLIQQGQFSYERVNVEAQEADGASLLNVVKAMLRIRKSEAAFFAHGHFSVLEAGHDAVLAYQYQIEDRRIIVLHNFSGEHVKTDIRLSAMPTETITPLLENGGQLTVSDKQITAGLPAYAYCWFKV